MALGEQIKADNTSLVKRHGKKNKILQSCKYNDPLKRTLSKAIIFHGWVQLMTLIRTAIYI